MTEPVSAVGRRGLAAPECLDLVHDMLAELWAGAPDVDDGDRMLFELAVVEIAGNIVEHAGPRPVRCAVDLAVHADRLEATFHDTGDDAGVDVDAARLPDAMAEAGRGLAMVRAAVDEVRHERVAGGNRWSLRKERAR